MNIDEYQNLLRRFCEQEQLDAVELLRDGVITLDGRPVAIHFEPDITTEHILVRAELGGIPDRIMCQCMEFMLLANHKWGMDGTMFSLQPDSREAVLTTRIAASASTTSSELRQALNELGALFQYWDDSAEDLRRNIF